MIALYWPIAAGVVALVVGRMIRVGAVDQVAEEVGP
jgi:hypothetical protein